MGALAKNIYLKLAPNVWCFAVVLMPPKHLLYLVCFFREGKEKFKICF